MNKIDTWISRYPRMKFGLLVFSFLASLFFVATGVWSFSEGDMTLPLGFATLFFAFCAGSCGYQLFLKDRVSQKRQ